MEYISAEEFLKQPKEVQEVFQEWWIPEKFDIYVDKKDMTQEESFDYLSEGMLNHSIRDNLSYRRDMIPLLTDQEECQYMISLAESFENDEGILFDKLGIDLLQAYWKVAIEIAKEELNHD